MNLPQDLYELANQESSDRVRAEMWQGQKVWVKKATSSKATTFHAIQRSLARLIPIEAFQPTVSLGGAAALRSEASRIKVLKELGFRVPEVLAVTDRWIVLSDIGESLDKHLHASHKPSVDEIYSVIRSCAHQLALLHLAGQYHGRAKINDFVYSPDKGIGLIDFEEDLSSMTPDAVQAREIWLFLGSVSRYSATNPDIIDVAYEAYRQTRGTINPQELRRMLRVLRFFKILTTPFLPLLSNDVKRAYAATCYLIDTQF